MNILEAYLLGWDYAENGANKKNCGFRIFSTKENKEAWEEAVNDFKFGRENKFNEFAICEVEE